MLEEALEVGEALLDAAARHASSPPHDDCALMTSLQFLAEANESADRIIPENPIQCGCFSSIRHWHEKGAP
jgi:hypothetical protein